MPRTTQPSSRRETRRFLWLALALLVCIAGALLEESFVHTDDGCIVEVHCVACRWACSAVSVSPEVGAPATTFVEVDDVVSPRTVQPFAPPSEAPTSRGPPAR